MKVKISILTFFICTIFSIGSYNSDIIEEVLKKTDCEVVESGIVFNLSNVKSDDVLSIEKSLDEFKSECEINVDKTPLEEERLDIYIISKNKNKNIKSLKYDIQKTLGVKNINIKSNVYYKGKLKEDDLEKYKFIMEKQLLANGCKNIKTSPIENGVVGTANTSTYDYIETNEGRVDISFALCRYKSGTYIIIGSPIITCGY